MSQIIKKGNLPRTPHTEFYAIPDVLALEEIHGCYGFSGSFSRKLHVRNYPTVQTSMPIRADFNFLVKESSDDLLKPYHIKTNQIPFEGCSLTSRKPLLFGLSTIISVSKPSESMTENTFFKNGEKHEAYFVQDGEGILKTDFGDISFKKGYYLIIPKGTIYQIVLSSKNAYFFIVESTFPIDFPPHYLNSSGQAVLTAPVVETEIESPELKDPIDKKDKYFIYAKHSQGLVSKLTFDHHPFDVIGWEGALYPFAFDIKNHHGIARQIHTAPPAHQTFQSGSAPFNGFSICSFAPQMEGWHEKDIPAPFAHSNVDSDEVMFFSNASYGAREGFIEEGSITFHPGSLPHSPHGNAALRSTNNRSKMNKRLAVMIDTFFESLKVTEEGYKYSDKEYCLSWYKADMERGKDAK